MRLFKRGNRKILCDGFGPRIRAFGLRGPEAQKRIRHAFGWLKISQEQLAQIPRLQALAKDIKDAGFQHILFLGMGGK